MSDYTPPTLVIPTPGGNPGDGSLNGKLTLRANSAPPTASASTTDLLKAYNTEQPLLFTYINSGGANWAVLTGAGPSYNVALLGKASQVTNLDSYSSDAFIAYVAGFLYANDLKPITLYTPTNYAVGSAAIPLKGLGLSPVFDIDNRTGLTAADASPTTHYTTTAAGQLYRLMGRILATAGTSPSATYTIKWTEGGTSITKSLTISAIDSDSDLSILIQPDNGTAITA